MIWMYLAAPVSEVLEACMCGGVTQSGCRACVLVEQASAIQLTC